MCTYTAISSHTDHFEIQIKRDSEESLLTSANLFPRTVLKERGKCALSYGIYCCKMTSVMVLTGIIQCNGGKLEQAEDLMRFRRLFWVRIEIDQLKCVNC